MPIRIDGETTILGNAWIQRELRVDGADLHTRAYRLRTNGEWGMPDWTPFVWPGVRQPVEAAVCVGGKEYWAGARRDPTVKETPFEDPAFRVESQKVTRTAIGEKLTLELTRARADVPELGLRLHYEIADGLPLLIKSLEVINESGEDMVVDNVTVDMHTIERLDKELRVFTDYYDVYGKSERKDETFAGWMRREFPRPIGLTLEPGAVFESFRVFQYATPDDADEAGLVRARIFHALAPWIADTAPGSIRSASLESDTGG